MKEIFLWLSGEHHKLHYITLHYMGFKGATYDVLPSQKNLSLAAKQALHKALQMATHPCAEVPKSYVREQWDNHKHPASSCCQPSLHWQEDLHKGSYFQFKGSGGDWKLLAGLEQRLSLPPKITAVNQCIKPSLALQRGLLSCLTFGLASASASHVLKQPGSWPAKKILFNQFPMDEHPRWGGQTMLGLQNV